MTNRQLLAAMQLTCNRCHHTWIRRTVRLPSNCPACKSPFWNIERVRKIALQRKAVKRG